MLLKGWRAREHKANSRREEGGEVFQEGPQRVIVHEVRIVHGQKDALSHF